MIENGDAVDATGCVLSPPKTDADEAVDIAGVPKILVEVDVGADEPKPVKPVVLVFVPNPGKVLLVEVPKILVVAG